MMAKQNQEGLTAKKGENFSEWYIQLMLKAELADYSSVSGCIVYRPLAYAMWEKIKFEVDKEFKKLGIKNSYFPLLIPEKLLTKEEEHVEGFAPEVAWVTIGGNTKLNERLAIRPTSEAIMYDSYSKWIRSHRDLPLLLNQWNNVIRWEFNNPVPFFRGREFLWNELHTVFATQEEALKHGEKVMKAYNKITEKLMAVPGVYGQKTEKEKFAGGVFSKKVHSYLPNGKVIEGTCFHYDGQNFAKAYDIKFADKDSKEEYAFQNTHAISTRMLGAMFAIHSDDKGLVIPPKIAPNKIVIIPLIFKDTKAKILKAAEKIKKELNSFEPIPDGREEISPGWKYNEWELKGVPIRIEIGPRDLEKKIAVVKIRLGEKHEIKLIELKSRIPKLLDEMQNKLYENAKKLLVENQKETTNKKEMIKFVKEKRMVRVPLCRDPSCEEKIKEETGAKVLFIDDSKKIKGEKCIVCNAKADYWVQIGKTY